MKKLSRHEGEPPHPGSTASQQTETGKNVELREEAGAWSMSVAGEMHPRNRKLESI